MKRLYFQIQPIQTFISIEKSSKTLILTKIPTSKINHSIFSYTFQLQYILYTGPVSIFKEFENRTSYSLAVYPMSMFSEVKCSRTCMKLFI